MKVYLRSTQNGRFYQGPSQWTQDQKSALDLQQVARAVACIFETHLENVEILLSYDEPRYDLVLPVPPSPSQFAPSQPNEEKLSPEAGKSPLRHKKGPRL